MNTENRPDELSIISSGNGQPPRLVLMGVAGSGKTVVGLELSEMTGWDFHDADDFHSPENKEKMGRGIPLTDDDREPWLRSLHDLLARYARRGEPVILACSALKRGYRDILAEGVPGLRFIYLKGSFATFERRMEVRKNHYMKAGMLESQFAALEEPERKEEAAVTIEVDRGTPKELAAEVYGRITPCS